MSLGKIYLVMNGGGEYESQWDQPLRAFRSKMRAESYMEEVKNQYEIDKKFKGIAQKAVSLVPRMRGGIDLHRWQVDVDREIRKALSDTDVPINKIDFYLKCWHQQSDIVYWIDEVEYDYVK